MNKKKGSFRFRGQINYLAWTPILAHCPPPLLQSATFSTNRHINQHQSAPICIQFSKEKNYVYWHQCYNSQKLALWIYSGAAQCDALQGFIILNMVICWITITNRMLGKANIEIFLKNSRTCLLDFIIFLLKSWKGALCTVFCWQALINCETVDTKTWKALKFGAVLHNNDYMQA